MQITISHEVTDEQIENLLDEASRGSNYWCGGVGELAYTSVCKDIIAGKHQIKLIDWENKDKVYWFDVQNIKAGLKIMAEKYPKHFGDALGVGSDYNSDADTGDVFLQCALLGEVIYG